MKKIKLCIICLIAVILCMCMPVAASAEEEKVAYPCQPVIGVVPVSDDCPLTVIDALFNFNIKAFPDVGADVSTLESSVQATYTVSNAGDTDVTAQMTLVLGKSPEYGTGAFPASATTITVNGAAVATEQKTVDGTYSVDFDLTVPATSNVTLAASFPVYPGTEPSYKPIVYSYGLSIEGLKGWNSFKKFTLNVESDYFVAGSSILGFEDKAEPKQEFSSIPTSDFLFYLCTEKNPKNPYATWSIVVLVVLMITITFGPVLLTLLIIHLVNKRRKRKQKERFDNRYNIYK